MAGRLAPFTRAEPDGGTQVEVSWTSPRATKEGVVRVLRRAGTCPRGADDPQARAVGSEHGLQPGRRQSVTDAGEGLTPGRWCYLVVVQTSLGQPGKGATATFDYRGRPPEARFRAIPSDTDPNTMSFEDGSSVANGRIVAWAWSFGDGATSAAQSPTHRYTAPGTYTVTLTVTDDSGRTATTTGEVQIDSPEAE